MKLQQVISSGKNFKRSSKDMWLKTVDGKITTTGAMLNYHLNADDILADDWKIEEDKPTSLFLDDEYGDTIHITIGSKEGIFFDTNPDMKDYSSGVQMLEKDIDKILTFLYNNTEIGKSRITPF